MRLIFLILALTSIAAMISCGGDDKSPAPSVSAVGTKSGAPAESASSTDPAVAPDAAEPTLDEALTEFTDGAVTADIAPGETYDLDPNTIAAEDGTPPACDNFQFDLTWQVQDPYPPDGVDLQWQIERNDAPVKVAEGPSGETSVGCDIVHALNNGADTISVAVRYKIGGLLQP